MKANFKDPKRKKDMVHLPYDRSRAYTHFNDPAPVAQKLPYEALRSEIRQLKMKCKTYDSTIFFLRTWIENKLTEREEQEQQQLTTKNNFIREVKEYRAKIQKERVEITGAVKEFKELKQHK